MPVLDLAVILAYIVGTAWVSRAQENVKDYFVSGRTVPWWAIMGSIVATETSTVTFISVLGTLTHASQASGAVGVAAGGAVMLVVTLLTSVSWQWYVLSGSLVTLGAGTLASTVSGTPGNGDRRHG